MEIVELMVKYKQGMPAKEEAVYHPRPQWSSGASVICILIDGWGE